MKFFVLMLVLAIEFVASANILSLYPCPSISHQVVFRPLTLELLERGHRVTVVTPDPMYPKGGHENLTEIDVHDITYATLKKHFVSYVTGSNRDLLNQIKGISALISSSFEKQMKTKEVHDLINKKEKFDLILLEAMYTQGLALSHLLKAPTVLVSSFGPYLDNYKTLGIFTYPVLYQHVLRQRMYNLTLIEKISELYNQFVMFYELNTREDKDNQMLKNIFGPDTPSLDVLRNYVDMLFINVHPIWNGNTPVPPNVIHMGGLHIKPSKKLPEDLQEYLDASDNGVIYFSFGTNVQLTLLPQSKMAIFETVLSQLPYNIIWKHDNDSVVIKSKNIKVFKWLPQADLLRHPNVKLFITQGGLQSTDEAITAGVPLLGIPMLGDQWYNVEKYIYHEIGQRIYFEDITEEGLRSAILEVSENNRYKDNILRLRSLMSDQPEAPLQRAMWWIEYVLRHGGAKHLRAPTANITWTEFLELDLIIFLTSSFLILCALTFLVLRILVSIVLKRITCDQKLKTM